MGCCKLKYVLEALDVLIAWVIIFPLGILYWRGTWDIWVHYINVDCTGYNRTGETLSMRLNTPSRWSPGGGTETGCQEVVGLWLSAAVGAAGMILINSLSPLLLEYVTPNRMHMCWYVLISRFYLYVMAFLNIGFWRGVWNLSDHYGTLDVKENSVGLGAALALCFLTRVFRLCQSLPWETGNDLEEGIFESSTWLETSVEKDGWWKWCLDQTLSTVLAQSIAIFVWRCMWNLMDQTILPDNFNVSNGVTLGVGMGGMLLLYLIHRPVVKASAKLDSKPKLLKILLEDLWYIPINTFIVMAWRGAWNLIAVHFLPDPTVGSWTCHAIGFVGLILMQKGSGSFDNGVSIDGGATNGEGARPYVEFLQYIFRKRINEEKNDVTEYNMNITSAFDKESGKLGAGFDKTNGKTNNGFVTDKL